MKLLLRQPTFWIATIMVLILGIGSLSYFMPSLFTNLQNYRSQSIDLSNQIAQKEQFITQVTALEKDSTTVDSLYATASTILPDTVQADILSLLLEGLVKDLNLTGITITAPFSQATAATTTAPVTGGDVKPGGISNSTTAPVVKSDGSQATFSIAGTMSFSTIKTLLIKLRAFPRWNKVTSIDISSTGGITTATITARIFWKPASSAEFTGSSDLLTKAKTLFTGVSHYASTPNAAIEGSYGRNDPFANP